MSTNACAALNIAYPFRMCVHGDWCPHVEQVMLGINRTGTLEKETNTITPPGMCQKRCRRVCKCSVEVVARCHAEAKADGASKRWVPETNVAES